MELRCPSRWMNYGFDPSLSEGAVKPPVFLTSTFVFRTAEEGRDFFDEVSGRQELSPGESAGLVYSRFNHPNSEIVEDRLAVFEGTENCALFSSGMSAISTTLLAYHASGRRRPALPAALRRHGDAAHQDASALRHPARPASRTASTRRSSAQRRRTPSRKVACPPILIETPANPTNGVVDIALLRRVADHIGRRQDGHTPVLACDNTMLGPVFQRPIQHGADISLYSLTKYVGGHSDLIAGAALGSRAVMKPMRVLRGAIGTQLDPHSCWMLGRSLETLSDPHGARRPQRACSRLTSYAITRRSRRCSTYRSTLRAPRRRRVFAAQSTGAGSTFSFDIAGGLEAAFRFLNALHIFKLAVSLGGTESLASLPCGVTHWACPSGCRSGSWLPAASSLSSARHPATLVAERAEVAAGGGGPPAFQSMLSFSRATIALLVLHALLGEGEVLGGAEVFLRHLPAAHDRLRGLVLQRLAEGAVERVHDLGRHALRPGDAVGRGDDHVVAELAERRRVGEGRHAVARPDGEQAQLARLDVRLPARRSPPPRRSACRAAR